MSILAGQRLTKVHATENDFLIFEDFDAELKITSNDIAALCNRRSGFGADGMIRAINTTAHEVGYLVDPAGVSTWFMDYYNADGSVAQMCGNGIRAFVHYLRLRKLIENKPGSKIKIATRGGVREVELVSSNTYRVNMGPAGLPAGANWSLNVHIPGLANSYLGLQVAMPNPHTVISVSRAELGQARLPVSDPAPAGQEIKIHPAPQGGTNVELICDLGQTRTDSNVGRIEMRVFERGVGETFSCGTGCCAAALAAYLKRGEQAPTKWEVTVPGGTVNVEIYKNEVFLTGPAELVGSMKTAISELP